MNGPRKATSEDIERMSQAVALVGSYDIGESKGDYKHFARMTRELHDEHGLEGLRATAKFAWMLLESIEASSGVDKDDVLSWYGIKFATRAEELRE